jgi:leucyl/phenylalanyl-tRNA---protein transferase
VRTPSGPVEPPPTPWQFPAVDGPEDFVARGADLEPGTLLAAYRSGIFPMPLDRREMAWWSPAERGVLPLGELRVSRSLRQSAKHFRVSIDSDFEAVLSACAGIKRPGGWISDDIVLAYLRLHDLGWAHSVETRDRDGRLVGGLYGLAIGGLFAGESMFHLARDASKAALVTLVGVLSAAGSATDRLLDVQWATPHLESLGVRGIPRPDYLARLRTALTLPLPAVFGHNAAGNPTETPADTEVRHARDA